MVILFKRIKGVKMLKILCSFLTVMVAASIMIAEEKRTRPHHQMRLNHGHSRIKVKIRWYIRRSQGIYQNMA